MTDVEKQQDDVQDDIVPDTKNADVDEEGIATPAPEAGESKGSWFKRRVLGDYDYKLLCTPKLNPWAKDDNRELPFYGPDDKLAILQATLLGFQHSLAVVGGTVVPGILLGNQDPTGQAGPYLVSYALIASGICTFIQVLHTKIWRTKYYLGSGLLCVIATSFAFLPTAQSSIDTLLAEGYTFDEAYGSLLGVFMVGAICQSGLAFIPGHVLRKIFPPWLAGLCVFLIGVSLVGVGVKSWGGGDDCAFNLEAPCQQVGDSHLLYGSAEYIGLGFLVMSVIVFMELFGSPFMRSCSIAIALLFGYLIAAVTKDHEGNGYTDITAIQEAPVVLFLWVKTFPIGFYPPALIPVLIAYIVSTVETYGDTTATAEASGFRPDDPKTAQRYDETIQGGLLGDAFNSFLSALFMLLPSTTLSQNIGIISLTNVASRGTGYACASWMIIYGIFGKIGAFFTSIPQPVLGGMTTFLFTNIAVSGIKVMSSRGISRRSRFIMAVAGSFGIGTIVFPAWFTSGNFLNCSDYADQPGVRGLCDAVILTLSTGYAIGCLVALILNGVLPSDPEDEAMHRAEIDADLLMTESITQKVLEGEDTVEMQRIGEARAEFYHMTPEQLKEEKQRLEKALAKVEEAENHVETAKS